MTNLRRHTYGGQGLVWQSISFNLALRVADLFLPYRWSLLRLTDFKAI